MFDLLTVIVNGMFDLLTVIVNGMFDLFLDCICLMMLSKLYS